MLFKRIAALTLAITLTVGIAGCTGKTNSAAKSMQLLTDSYIPGNGRFTFAESNRFYVLTESAMEVAQFISQQFALENMPSSQPLPVVYGEEALAKSGDILLSIDPEATGGVEEGYKIVVDSDHIRIIGADSRGLMYGAFMVIKHLRVNGSATIKGCTIQDVPDAEERTVMLDCGRKYFTPEWIKNYIRQMAFMGYNTLELHFAEDQGIRLDIWDEAYFTSANGNDFTPLVGGWAATWLVAGYRDYEDKDKYLTAAEMVEILEVAQQYQIDIIPSFDTPMHCQYLRRKWSAYVAGDNPDNLTCLPVNTEFSFCYNGTQYSKDGMIDLSTGEFSAYSSYDCWENLMVKNDSGVRESTKVIDVTNIVGRSLLEAILEDYADFFKQYGCTEFNICGDEVAFYNKDGWETYAREVLATDLSDSTLAEKGTKYDTFIHYINEITELLQSKGYAVRMYNDFVNRKTKGSTARWYKRNLEFNKDLEIMYWWLPEDNSNVVNVQSFVNNGYKLYNCVQNYCYYVLATNSEGEDARDPDAVVWTWQYASADRIYAHWNPTVFTHPTQGETTVVDASAVSGGYFLVWCDYGAMNTEEEVWNGIDETGKYNIIERMWSNIAKMWNYDLNDSLEYGDFASLATAMGYYPGYTECTAETISQQAVR